MYFGYDSGNHMIHGTQTGKCFDSPNGRCEECGSDSGTEVLVCGYTNEVTTPDECTRCEVDACPGRHWAFRCSTCGWYTQEDQLMGMDVYGKNPKSDAGRYFRNNIWWWGPLWTYCCKVGPRVALKVESGFMNDGDGLGARDSKKLADILEGEVLSGRAQLVEDEAKRRGKQESCPICSGTGRVGIPAQRRDPSRLVRAGKIDAPPPEPTGKVCPQCEGKGSYFTTTSPFSVENVKEFIAFLRDCGGFEIC
jgi:hypothetical protein